MSFLILFFSLKKYHSNTAQKRNHAYDVVLEEIAGCLISHENIEEKMLVRELSDQINIFLGTLRVKERTIFIQRYWYCASIQEIAKEMNMSTNQVTVRLHRTREKLKTYLKKEGH